MIPLFISRNKRKNNSKVMEKRTLVNLPEKPLQITSKKVRIVITEIMFFNKNG